ncbi:CREB-regulated transcription coactivator 1-like isoform X3 [Daphnia pulicaria]|uniref:CREB-regulated transcription coactivator 1-like isoform X3 n=1 Tax=Daphnia pulicaria TaxID=35523 RepID=UPI001EECCF1C|nr:CREB-regulated transcription coactivator 1-like isoform X3 [Daphnia pulicaria]
MSNPRKFSEKIALHTQKQAEETADFEKIMNEVRNAKPNQINGDCSPSHLVISPISPFRAGSLPNVNSPSTNSTSIDLQSALSNLGDMRAGRESGYRDRRSAGPGGGGYSPGSSLGSVRPSRRSDQTTSPNPHSYQMHPSGGLVQAPQISGSVGSPNLSGSTGAGSGGNNGGLSTNVAYLSPPLDPCWRRHSDSALHQAAMVSGDGVIGNASTNLSRRGQDGNNYLNSADAGNPSLHLGISIPSDGRPKSCCDVSRVPGINICPGPEPNGIQIPIGNNTGSLPDLTNLQFASPLSDPIDEDDSSLQTHSLYSTSPNVVSPSYGGNGLIDHTHPLNSLNMGLNPGPPGGSSRGSSPGPSPSQRRRPHHQLVNLQLRSPSHGHSSQNHSQNQSSNLLNVPSNSMNSRLLHSSKGIALDPSGMSVPSYQSYLYQNSGCGADYGQPISPAHSPTHMMSPSQPIPTHGGLLTAYRNPQPILRPSPISSPTLVVPGHMNYRSNSPGDGTNCASSAPPSPVSQSLSPASSPGLAASPASPFTDQMTTMNCQNQMGSGSGGNLNQMSFYPNQSNVLNQFEQFNMANISMDISLDPFYSQPSQFMFGGRLELNQQTAPQTPQTPSSIPDIVLQDFSCTPEELARHNSHDLSSAMGSSFEGVDFYPTDDALRDGLDPIDFDGLQILTNSTLVTDPSTEDHFRLDRM